jgi:tetratricopeptide (TPR) repeat protein
MSKKSKSSAKHKKNTASVASSGPAGTQRWLTLINQQVVQKDYQGAVENCERLLGFLPKHSAVRVEVLGYLGVVQGMLQNYPQSYEAFTEALEIEPENAELWYNRGMASRFTTRLGRSLRDYERAAALNKRADMIEKLEEALEVSREFAQKSIELRGPNFTLDQLIEQEDFYQHGLRCIETGQWVEAERAFRASIALGDGLAQPWGNLGMSLMMQERYDEAEAAIKRALVIEPDYAIAKGNLAALPEIRRKGPPKIFAMSDPMRVSKINQSITFLPE